VSIHEHLATQARRELKEVGWTNGPRLAKVSRRDVQEVIVLQELGEGTDGQETGPWNSSRAGRTNSGAFQSLF
jgi:hypothetical protein